jgi:hypothetical protein
MFFPPHCTLGWVFLIMYLGCHITIVANLWILWGSTFFVTHVVEEKTTYIMLCEILLWPFWKMWEFVSHKGRPMSFFPMPYNFCIIKSTLCYELMVFAHWWTLSSSTPFDLIWKHCVINWWCSHIGKHCHHRPYSIWFGFEGCFFLWGCYNNHNSCDRRSLSWLIPNEHVFPSNINVSTWCGGANSIGGPLFQFCGIL